MDVEGRRAVLPTIIAFIVLGAVGTALAAALRPMGGAWWLAGYAAPGLVGVALAMLRQVPPVWRLALLVGAFVYAGIVLGGLILDLVP